MNRKPEMNAGRNSNQSRLPAVNTNDGFDRGGNARDGAKTRTTEQAELEKIKQKVNAVKAGGFGEVRILIKNGAIYRILVTEEELFKDDKIK